MTSQANDTGVGGRPGERDSYGKVNGQKSLLTCSWEKRGLEGGAGTRGWGSALDLLNQILLWLGPQVIGHMPA